MSWAGFKKGLTRAGISVLQRAGQIDKTTDAEFDQLLAMYRALEKNMANLSKEGKAYFDSIRKALAVQMLLSIDLLPFFDDKSAKLYAATKLKEQLTILDEQVRLPAETQFREQFFEPTIKFQALFEQANELIKKREHKLLDYDLAKGKGTKAETVEGAKVREIYEAVHAQATGDMIKMIDMVNPYLDACFDGFIGSQAYLYGNGLTLLNAMKTQMNFPVSTDDHISAISALSIVQ